MFLTTDREYYLVKVPLVVRSWSVTPDAIREVRPEAVNPKTDRFPADNYAPRRQKVFNISRTQS